MPTQHPPQACLACGHVVDMAAKITERGVGDSRAKEGDATLCIACGCLMMFGPGLKFRWPHVGEIAQLLRDKRVTTAMQAIEQVHGRRKQ